MIRNERLRRALVLRAELYVLIRAFFSERGVLEVETPVMSAGANTDPNIQSFSTRFSGHADAGSPARWLRTSSEFAQKRLLAAGVGDCYELGRVFRNGEAGRRHNPEFTMLEWYRVGRDHRWLIEETTQLVQAAMLSADRKTHVRMYSYAELFEEIVGIDPHRANEPDIDRELAEVRIDLTGLSRDDKLDLLLTHRIQPNFPADRVTVIFDYPATQAALAKIRADDPPVAERFEMYVGVHELANGYHELTDAAEQRRRFDRDNLRCAERGLPVMPIDHHFLAALESGMPDCAGVALGIERLLMAMLATDDIADVLAYPFAEA